MPLCSDITSAHVQPIEYESNDHFIGKFLSKQKLAIGTMSPGDNRDAKK